MQRRLCMSFFALGSISAKGNSFFNVCENIVAKTNQNEALLLENCSPGNEKAPCWCRKILSLAHAGILHSSMFGNVFRHKRGTNCSPPLTSQGGGILGKVLLQCTIHPQIQYVYIINGCSIVKMSHSSEAGLSHHLEI